MHCSKLDRKSIFGAFLGLTEALQLEVTNPLGSSRPKRGRAAYGEGEEPICAHPTNWSARKLGPNMLCLHTQNKKNLCLSLS